MKKTPATKIVALPQKTANEQRITNNEQLSLLCDSAREILLVACLCVFSRRQAFTHRQAGRCPCRL